MARTARSGCGGQAKAGGGARTGPWRASNENVARMAPTSARVDGRSVSARPPSDPGADGPHAGLQRRDAPAHEGPDEGEGKGDQAQDRQGERGLGAHQRREARQVALHAKVLDVLLDEEGHGHRTEERRPEP